MIRKLLYHLRSGTVLNVSTRWLKRRLLYAHSGDALRPSQLIVRWRDVRNVIRYGVNAPKFAEGIMIAPSACLISNKVFLPWQQHSATVVESWPYKHGDLVPASQALKMEIQSDLVGVLKSGMEHWLMGVPWQETWNYKRIVRDLNADGFFCANQLGSREELDRRCMQLDLLFARVRREKRLMKRSECTPSAFREEDSTMIHVGPNCELVVAGLGLHRFTIALILGLPYIPAQIGCVHRCAIYMLPGLRSASVVENPRQEEEKSN